MTIQDLGSLGELIAALATVATLAYLALQIRQNTASNRQAAAQSTMDAINQLNFLGVAHPEIIDLTMRGLAELPKLNPGERARFHLHWMSSFIVYQQAFFHARRSEIEPSLWRPIETHLFQFVRTPGLSQWWEENQHRFSPEFVAYVRAGEPIG